MLITGWSLLRVTYWVVSIQSDLYPFSHLLFLIAYDYKIYLDSWFLVLETGV